MSSTPFDQATVRKRLSPDFYLRAMTRCRDACGLPGLALSRQDEEVRDEIFGVLKDVRKSGVLEPFPEGADMGIREVIAWNRFVSGDNGVPRGTLMNAPLPFAIYAGAARAASDAVHEMRSAHLRAAPRRRRGTEPSASFSPKHLSFFREPSWLHREFSPDPDQLRAIAGAASEGAVTAACGLAVRDGLIDLVDHRTTGDGVVLIVAADRIFRPLAARLSKIYGHILPLVPDADASPQFA